jgi:hypothetical protein
MLKEIVMTPVERLRAFILDMLQWEVTLDAQSRISRARREDAYIRGDPDAGKQIEQEGERMRQEAKEKLRSIFTEHLSVKALATIALPRLDTVNTSAPPEFNQEMLAETESRKGKTTYIETFDKSRWKQRIRYTLVMENDEPKIDAVHDRPDGEDKWNTRVAI